MFSWGVHGHSERHSDIWCFILKVSQKRKEQEWSSCSLLRPPGGSRAPCFTLINEAVKHQFFKEQNDDVTNRKRQDLNFIYSVKQETEQNPDEPNRTTTNQIHSVTQGDGFILNWSFFSHVPQNESWRKSNDDFFYGWNMNSHCPEIKVLENHFPLISATSFGLIAGSEASVRPSVQL